MQMETSGCREWAGGLVVLHISPARPPCGPSDVVGLGFRRLPQAALGIYSKNHWLSWAKLNPIGQGRPMVQALGQKPEVKVTECPGPADSTFAQCMLSP